MNRPIETTPIQIQVEDDRTGLSLATLRRALADNLFYLQEKFHGINTKNDYYMALAYTVRDRLLHRWLIQSKPISKKMSKWSVISQQNF